MIKYLVTAENKGLMNDSDKILYYSFMNNDYEMRLHILDTQSNKVMVSLFHWDTDNKEYQQMKGITLQTMRKKLVFTKYTQLRKADTLYTITKGLIYNNIIKSVFRYHSKNRNKIYNNKEIKNMMSNETLEMFSEDIASGELIKFYTNGWMDGLKAAQLVLENVKVNYNKQGTVKYNNGKNLIDQYHYIELNS